MRVRGFADIPTRVVKGGWGGEPLRMTVEAIKHCTLDYGTVTPDGSLSVEAAPWHARHYRRAVMRGAGVYRWGLWAMLAPGRPAAEPDAQAGAPLGVNVAAQMGSTLVYYDSLIRRDSEAETVNDSPLISNSNGTAKNRRRIRRKIGLVRKRRAGRSKRPTPITYTVQLIVSHNEKVGEMLSYGFGPFWASVGAKARLGRSHRLITALTEHMRRARRPLAPALARLIKRGDAYRAHLARIVKPRRAPRRAPRPLHAQPRPPAAPLAPPALA